MTDKITPQAIKKAIKQAYVGSGFIHAQREKGYVVDFAFKYLNHDGDVVTREEVQKVYNKMKQVV